MGTLASVLAGKRIRTDHNLYEAKVTGDIEDVDGVLKITHINVQYTLKVSEDKRRDAREALDSYLSGCPGAQSVIGCIEITHSLALEDMPG